MLKSKRYIVPVQADRDEYFIALPDEVLKDLNWEIGDSLIWKQIDADSFSIQKREREEMDLFVIDTVVVHKRRYFIEAKSLEHAYDTVVCKDDEIKEKFQEQIMDEVIFNGRKINRKDYDDVFSEMDNSNELIYPDMIYRVQYL